MGIYRESETEFYPLRLFSLQQNIGIGGVGIMHLLTNTFTHAHTHTHTHTHACTHASTHTDRHTRTHKPNGQLPSETALVLKNVPQVIFLSFLENLQNM